MVGANFEGIVAFEGKKRAHFIQNICNFMFVHEQHHAMGLFSTYKRTYKRKGALSSIKIKNLELWNGNFFC